MKNTTLSRIILTVIFAILMIVHNYKIDNFILITLIHIILFYLYLFFNTFLCKKVMNLSNKFNKWIYYILLLPASLLIIGYILYLLATFIFANIPALSSDSGWGIIVLYVFTIFFIVTVIVLPYLQSLLLLLLNKIRKNK